MSKKLLVALIGLIAFFVEGCNLFESLDTETMTRTDREKIQEGNLALNVGNFSRAHEIFYNLNIHRSWDPEVIRGLGEAKAGLGGFNLLSILSTLQNNAANNHQSSVLFKTAYSITNREQVEQAVKILMTNPNANRTDRLARALMRIPTVVKLFLEKYDTNRNKKLDINDDIAFDTNDKTLPNWPSIYRDLITGPSSKGQTLEEVFIDLAIGFDGRGASWTFITPVNNRLISGTYSEANKATILAVGDLAAKIIEANRYYNIHPASFAAAIIDFDGINQY